MENKKVLYTAMKPTGKLQLGNFIGVGKDFQEYQKNYNSVIAVADLHAMTMTLPKEDQERLTYELFSYFIAFGLNPNKSTLYVQSQVKEHAELAWILNNFTMFGEASRMTQYKDHVAKSKEVNLGLFCYPVLMAGDILLYESEIVPVGIDQLQHVELCRDIANRFNNRCGETFVIPKAQVKKEGAKIMGLLNPEKKMSKSELGEGNVIYLDDSDETIVKKIKRAVTDSDGKVYYDPKNKPGVSNLLTIYSCLKNIPIKKAEKEFETANYGTLKQAVADAIISALRPVKEKFNELMLDKNKLQTLMKKGAKKAQVIAKRTVDRVKQNMGIVNV